MRKQLSLSLSTLIYTITLTLIIQLTYVVFAISVIQRSQFGSLAEFSVGILSAAYAVPGQATSGETFDAFCAEGVEIDDVLIDFLNEALMTQNQFESDGSGILTLAYNCANRKVTSSESPVFMEGARGPHINMVGDDEGGLLDLLNSLKLLWILFIDRTSTIYTIEYMTPGSEATVLLSFDKAYLAEVLIRLLSRYLLAAVILVSLNILFVFSLVRFFVANPIRHLTKSLQSLTRTGIRSPASHRSKFQFQEIHEANRALESISELLESRRAIEDRKDGMNHEIRNDLQRLYGQIFRLNLSEKTERLLHLSLDRLSNRLGDILEFVTWQKGELKQGAINLAEMIDRCAELTIEIWRYMVDDETKHPVLVSTVPGDIMIASNREALRIILENLFRNSVDAFNTESKEELRDSLMRELAETLDDEDRLTALREKMLTVTTGEWERQIRISASREKSHVRIRITDNADGIQFNLRDTIFERGVTTNPDDKARRGIGLLFTKILVEDLGGTIALRSTRHRDDIMRELLNLPRDRVQSLTPSILRTGTTFELLLPVS
ncbi:MAG: HAMP domain-containing sensor histidine kinase [Rhodobacteraceae bacterium]|nr:HAMP domain-containing sensor histidine kinase [Paracoccaceae bacterium]